MTTLTQADLEDFARLSIPAELLDLAGVVRVSDSEARSTFGIKGGGDMAGIAFQYFDPETMSNGRRRIYVRIRRDHPELEDGKLKKKYVAPYGDRKRLYFPPTPELFADVTVPIVLVEAEKSSLAMTAWSGRTGRRILPLAMGGCYGWIGNTGIKETPTGERVPETGAIHDLNICRDRRSTYVLLDSNCTSNPKVLAARSRLVRQLRKQRADVHIVDLPVGQGINGPDDYIGVMGDEAMTQLFEGTADGAKILNEIACFIRRFMRMPESQVIAVTLWCAHTYAVQAAIWTPYLAVTSAEKRSGKSRLLELLSFLVQEPWSTSSASAASLFREIDQRQPTLLLDETDPLFKADKETAQAIRGILNAGAHYKGVVSRIVGQGSAMKNKNFSAFCPKALGGIGSLPDTVADRSLPIKLKRKPPGEKVERLRERFVEPLAKPLRQSLANWITKKLPTLQDALPDLPEELNDRQQDGAEPLLAIADAAGDDWSERARAALCEIYGTHPADDTSLGIQLLGDVRLIYYEDLADKMPTTELLEKLWKVETSPWAEWNHGKPMTASGLSKLLRPFEIFPKTVRIGTGTAKGYERVHFEDAWGRYLPNSSPISASSSSPVVTRSQSSTQASVEHSSTRNTETHVTGSRRKSSPVSMGIVTAVTDQKGEETSLEGKTEECGVQQSCYVRGGHTSMVRGEI
jgi:uncharacterized protein DUF3631